MDKQKKKIPARQNNPPPRVHGGAIVAALIVIFVLVYMGVTALAYYSRQEIPVVEIKVDVIDMQKDDITGVLIFNEDLYYAESADFEFLVNNHERVKKYTPIISLIEPGQAAYIERNLSEIGEQLYEYQARRAVGTSNFDTVLELNFQIKTNADNNLYRFAGTDMSYLAEFAQETANNITIRNERLLSGSVGAKGVDDEKARYETELSKYLKTLNAQNSGILTYHTDGLESVFSYDSLDSLTPDDIKNSKYSEIPIARVVTDNNWYIAAFAEPELTDDLKEGDVRSLYIQNNGAVESVRMTVAKLEDRGSYVFMVFKSSRDLLRFIDARFVSFKLTDTAHRGLKIPNSSITERTFFLVPEHIVQDGTVTLQHPGGDRRVTVTTNRTNAPVGYIYCMLDFSKFAIGDVLTVEDGEAYTLSVDTFKSLSGVYRVTGSTPRFICIDDTNSVTAGGYTVLDPALNTALAPHDRIALNAESVSVNAP